MSDNETTEILKRTIIRLVLVAKGFDSALDPFLKRIQETVKQDTGNNFGKKLDDLADTMIRTVEDAPPPPFEKILQRLPLSRGGYKKARSHWEKLLKNPAKVTDKNIDELIDLMGLSVDSPVADENRNGKKKGFLSKIFRQEKPENEDGTPCNSNLVLKSLLQEVRWPAPIASEIQSLVDQLGEEASEDTWLVTVRRMNDLINQVFGSIQSEVESTENFLSLLSGKLQELDGFVLAISQQRQESIDSGRAFELAVDEQVDGLSDSVEKAADLQQLKVLVAERIDIIQSHVHKHIQAEDERHNAGEEREKQLREQIADLESEAEGLRQQMADAHHRAMLDAVTGLPNRMAYEERIQQEFQRWKRFGEPLVMMVWDIDDFKKINDQYGHRAGDKALNVIASRLKSCLRETDFIGRYGGEEFVVLLPGTDISSAQQVAEKMRQTVEKAGLRSKDTRIEVTISCGMSQFREGDEPGKVFERADQALYQAKGNGKNQWVAG